MPTNASTNNARLTALMQTVHWTDRDIEELVRIEGVDRLTFAPGSRLPNGALRRLSALPLLRSVSLEDCHITDSDITDLAAIAPHLRELKLTGTQITNDALIAIGAGFANLNLLYLGRTAITDAGLPPLGMLAHLEVLWLNETAVTDAGMPALGHASHLTALNVQNTRVTPAGLDAQFRASIEARRSPKYQVPDPADVEACHALLKDFFAAMNAWEEETHPIMDMESKSPEERNDRRASLDEQQRKVAEIFDRFLTDKPRKNERDQALTLRSPLTYSDVAFFADERASRNHIDVITREGASRHLYAMVCTPDGWRIDARKWWGLGGWKRDFF